MSVVIFNNSLLSPAPLSYLHLKINKTYRNKIKTKKTQSGILKLFPFLLKMYLEEKRSVQLDVNYSAVQIINYVSPFWLNLSFLHQNVLKLYIYHLPKFEGETLTTSKIEPHKSMSIQKIMKETVTYEVLND